MKGSELNNVEKRNSSGFFDNVEYAIGEKGRVNWRAMVDPKHLFPNKQWFERFDKEVPKDIEGLLDSQLLIKLSGIKELAQLRGYSKVTYEVVKCEMDHVSVKCRIEWIENSEDGTAIIFEDMANATKQNASDFGAKFLETIAANRAFVRAVRNFLNIHVTGSDEIDSSGSRKTQTDSAEDDSGVAPTPRSILISLATKRGCASFSEFQEELRKLWKAGVYKNENIKNWLDWGDIPIKEARTLIAVLSSN
jgi:hypothetical protein